jgi:hypothetical protein
MTSFEIEAGYKESGVTCLQSRLQAASDTFHSLYSDLICQYDIPFGQMLSDVFHTNCKVVFGTQMLTADCSVYLN